MADADNRKVIKMKKLIALLFAISIIFCSLGCNGTTTTGDAKPQADTETAPAEEAPAEEAPAEEAPVEEAPVEEAPVEDAPAEDAPAEDAPTEE